MMRRILQAIHLKILLLACLPACVTQAVYAIALPGQGSWDTTLQARDFDNDVTTAEGYYDVSLNITWLADANFARTSGFDPDGRISWDEARVWVAGLDFGPGIDNWRLPQMLPVNGVSYYYDTMYDGSSDRGYNISAPGTPYAGSVASEMAYMYYNTLGNLGYFDTAGNSPQQGWGLTNTGPFRNIGASANWVDLEKSNYATWYFHYYDGAQGYVVRTYPAFVWAVHPGDVGTPIPPVPVFTDAGDVTLDGMVDLADVMLLLKVALGTQALTQQQLAKADVAPLVSGSPAPDGQVNGADMYLVLRKLLGLIVF